MLELSHLALTNGLLPAENKGLCQRRQDGGEVLIILGLLWTNLAVLLEKLIIGLSSSAGGFG